MKRAITSLSSAPAAHAGRTFLKEWWAETSGRRRPSLSDSDRQAIRLLREKDRVLPCGWTSMELRLYCLLYVEDNDVQSVSDMP